MRTEIIKEEDHNVFCGLVDTFCNRNIVTSKHFFVVGGGAYPVCYVAILRYLLKKGEKGGEIDGDEERVGCA